MNNHPTKYKGDLAVARVCADLMEQQWFVLAPVHSEHLPFDLLAYRMVKGRPLYIRVQVKSYPHFSTRQTWKNRTKYVSKETYSSETIDFFATYLPEAGCSIFVPIRLMEQNKIRCITIEEQLPNKGQEFWWYEDFLRVSFKDRQRKTRKDFGYSVEPSDKQLKARQVSKTTRYDNVIKLQKQVWKYTLRDLAKEYGVSDVALRKNCVNRGIVLPPMGFFIMNKENKRRVIKAYKAQVMAKMKEWRARRDLNSRPCP